MIYSYKHFLLEKSSLTSLGIPRSVMQNIQRDYALNPNSEWVEYTLKKDIKDILIKNKNNLLLQIGKDAIKVFVSVYEYNKKLYFIDRYVKKTGEFDDFWQKLEREGATLTSMLYEVEMENKYYLLKNNDFSVVKSEIRKLEKEEKDFDSFNNKFREDLLDYFTKVLKNSYSTVSKKIEHTIVDNLSKVKPNLTEKDIKDILYQNVEKAKKSKDYQTKAQNISKYKLDTTEQQFNSLTIFDEYLLQFEDEYSEKYHKYYNIKSLVEEFSMLKIFTAFIYYLYTGNLMDLYGYKNVTFSDDLEELNKILDNDF
jgi:hypothetical protein